MEKKNVLVYEESEKAFIYYNTNGDELYDIPFTALDSSSHILDWIFQLHNKQFITAEHIYSFIEQLKDLSMLYFNINAQSAFCPGGSHVSINWEKKETQIL